MNIINQTNQTNQPTNNESIKIDFDNGTLDEVLDLNNKELSQLMHKNIVKDHDKRRYYIKMKVNRTINYNGLLKTTILITVKNVRKYTMFYVLKFSKRIKFKLLMEKKHGKAKILETIISARINKEYQDPLALNFDPCDLMDDVFFKEEYTMRSTKPSKYRPIGNLLPKRNENIILNENYYESLFNKIRDNIRNKK